MDTELKAHIETAFANAENGVSKITSELMQMEGMTGIKTRHFYNNLLNRADSRYLEIGSWKGSSVCSAMCGNNATVLCIDNWSEFGGPKEEFLKNFNNYKGMNNANFLEQDCFKVDLTNVGKFNIYMYDGYHSEDAHFRALVHFYNSLDDTFIFVVDDWNLEFVRNGTWRSFAKLKLTVLYDKEIFTPCNGNGNGTVTPVPNTWWNGIYVAILKKN